LVVVHDASSYAVYGGEDKAKGDELFVGWLVLEYINIIVIRLVLIFKPFI
jgi:hypothetical protein